jgi:hypothetical protein
LLAAIEGVAILASNTSYDTDTTLYQPPPSPASHIVLSLMVEPPTHLESPHCDYFASNNHRWNLDP